ncbi:hypothetical protein WJX77_010437 [Trebouxia sp. C0004]
MEQERALVVHPLFVHTLPKHAPRPPQRWGSLPSAILHKLASALTTAQDLTTFEVLSRSCWVAAQDDELWKRLCYQKFSPPRSAPCKNWKALYRFNHSLLHQVISQTKHTRRPFFVQAQSSIHIRVSAFA